MCHDLEQEGANKAGKKVEVPPPPSNPEFIIEDARTRPMPLHCVESEDDVAVQHSTNRAYSTVAATTTQSSQRNIMNSTAPEALYAEVTARSAANLLRVS